MTLPKLSPLLLGCLAGVLTACIGASWQIVSRSAALTPLGPLELAVLRYALPALILLPVLWPVGLKPAGVSWGVLFVLVCSSGLPFGLMAFWGTRFAPSAHMGVMMAATGPLMTAGLLWLVERRRITHWQALGLAAIAASVLLLASGSLHSTSSTWRGDALFLLAALMWSGFGLAFRRSGLTAWQAVAVVNAWSALAVLALAWVVGVPGFAQIDGRMLALQALWQGVMAGVLGLVSYTAAVRLLGAQAAAAFGALVPVLAAWGGWWILHEPLTVHVLIASSLATVGVGLAVGWSGFNNENLKKK